LFLPDTAFASLPAGLRGELVAAFGEIVRNHAEGRWEPAELNGGKLCEITYCILRGITEGQFPSKASKPRNMVSACLALGQVPKTSAPRSVRIQIPRMLVALYEIRSNRSVGHVGGEVDPNHMDAMCVLQMGKWIMAELVRVLHDLPVDEAVVLVDGLVEREVPLVWKVDGKRRVLDPKLKMGDKTLLLLHGCSGAVAEADIRAWVEHSNASVYRRDILKRAHAAKLLEYNGVEGTVTISPSGIADVEDRILKSA
jgi:hypothetical protein